MKTMGTSNEIHKRYKVLAALNNKTIAELIEEAIDMLERKYNEINHEQQPRNSNQVP